MRKWILKFKMWREEKFVFKYERVLAGDVSWSEKRQERYLVWNYERYKRLKKYDSRWAFTMNDAFALLGKRIAAAFRQATDKMSASIYAASKEITDEHKR